MSEHSPVLVEVTRGDTVESWHRGQLVVIDARGRIVARAGDPERPAFPRSAVKPLQALPLIETGTADALGLVDAELALACASHKGEPIHVATVAAFLAKAGLTPADLECGAHPPAGRHAAEALLRAGETPGPIHNNCSGKHTGFLVTARHQGEPTRGYIGHDHPVQRRAAAAMGEMMGIDIDAVPWGIDGCGIPSFSVPLRALAFGMARLADSTGLPTARVRAIGRIMQAMAAEPLMVDGTGTMTTEIMQIAGATVRLKPGAEGVYCAALPTLGLGVALKIEDGGKRAAELAMATVLDRLGCFDAGQRESLSRHLAPPIHNIAGRLVGEIRPAEALIAALPQHVV